MKTERYNRLIQLEGISHEGLEKLKQTRIAIVGCGTLGSIYSLSVVRLGVGFVRLIDRDIVEEHNLSTQLLFQEDDLDVISPKAIIAKKRLESINPYCEVEACPSDLTYKNAETLLGNVDLIFDATDNFETRFLINDFSLKYGIPWIYTGVVGYRGVTMLIQPDRSACLRCMMEEPPETGELPTCETEGVWIAAAEVIAGVGLTEAVKLTTEREVDSTLQELDLDTGKWTKIRVNKNPDCPACGNHDFSFLDGHIQNKATSLCGRDVVHIESQQDENLNLLAIAERLQSSYTVAVSDDLLKLNIPEGEIFLFRDGRAFVKGTSDPARARALYNRYISM
ncbi:hypothetical protein CEE37_09800 [candidate division LCP-89 bacterium B3_LCP]|uniref:THIF-type NAD/FAD binding fold domain-containing protein n=1 Tax=candidate division LCP-89 bacterium B3_LCP TaxID=2012998 RepID=A0A532UYJ9_UNCL8|nr:MAG: hypothetical protein CEE37_09800 [candidate division LCP-89 bacterium B3_LCP]